LFAYVSLDTGIGALLLLFAAVQITLIGAGLHAGERPHARSRLDPLTATAGKFLRAAGLAALLALVYAMRLRPHGIGVLWAILFGAIISGLGYALWHRVLPSLSAARAATVQLTGPVLAAALGVLVLCDPVTSRLLIAGVPLLCRVGLTMAR
jgi:drug/metabolite transporter (DMT)-like permease